MSVMVSLIGAYFNTNKLLYAFLVGLQPSCTSYRGPFSFDCYSALWYVSGCVESGHLNPSNWTRMQMARMTELNYE